MDSHNHHVNENLGSPESAHYDRQRVIDTFRKFVERGATDPADLDLSDPEVIEANRIHDSWDTEQQKIAGEAGTLEAKLESSLSRSTVMVDAGFSDPDYLDEVANDWLGGNDLPDAEQAGLTEVTAKIQAKIDEINSRLEP
jgi:hypothetical protein